MKGRIILSDVPIRRDGIWLKNVTGSYTILTERLWGKAILPFSRHRMTFIPKPLFDYTDKTLTQWLAHSMYTREHTLTRAGMKWFLNLPVYYRIRFIKLAPWIRDQFANTYHAPTQRTHTGKTARRWRRKHE